MWLSFAYCWYITMCAVIVSADENDSCRYTSLNGPVDGEARTNSILEKYEVGLFMVLGFGGFSVLIALVHNWIRKYVYGDAGSLDTMFDAGGKVSLSLTAVTVTSQALWPSVFLEMPMLTYLFGIGGALYFGLAIVVQMMLFPLLSLELKTKAPGAKTFLQVIYHRFGRPAHILYCIIALATNLIILSHMVMAAKSAIVVITNDASDEFIMMVVAILFGTYCFIGGLGTTFYISYFNTALTFVSLLVFFVQFYSIDNGNSFTSNYSMYDAMACTKTSNEIGNFDNSRLTFRSRSAAMLGLSVLFIALALTFCDQANWQSRIAAKPTQGVIGFFIGSFLYLSFPLAISFPATFGYVSMSYHNNGTHLLSVDNIYNGHIMPFIMNNVMGTTGAYLFLTMITMSLMSTGSGEVMAISSIIIYDIYKVYFNPYRSNVLPSECQLCGKTRKSLEEIGKDVDICSCIPATECKICQTDMEAVKSKRNFMKSYSCQQHGNYRLYENLLKHYKSWCMMWVSLAIIPFGLIMFSSGINLYWVLFFLPSLLSPFIVPLLLTITWAKCTGPAVIAGSVAGLVAAFAGNFIATHLIFEDGLSNFLDNTSAAYSLVAGCVSGIVVSIVVTVPVSLIKTHVVSKEDAIREWEKTLAIDNPLSPWERLYSTELTKFPLHTRVDVCTMSKIFKSARYIALIGGFVCIALFVVVVPAVALSFGVLSFDDFAGWFLFSFVICILGMLFVVIVPPAEEVVQIYRAYKLNRYRTVPGRTTEEHGKNEEVTKC